MKTIAKMILPAALAIGAFGVQAQTVETDYPRTFMSESEESARAGVNAPAPVQAEPFLIQSNSEGVRENPAHATALAKGRSVAEVRAEARIAMPPSGHNA